MHFYEIFAAFSACQKTSQFHDITVSIITQLLKLISTQANKPSLTYRSPKTRPGAKPLMLQVSTQLVTYLQEHFVHRLLKRFSTTVKQKNMLFLYDTFSDDTPPPFSPLGEAGEALLSLNTAGHAASVNVVSLKLVLQGSREYNDFLSIQK